MWRAIGKSVTGLSHIKGEIPCQDSSGYLRCQIAGEMALVIAISDGAGSAPLSQLGSQTTVSSLLRLAASFEQPVAEISHETVQNWLAHTLAHLNEVANQEQVELKNLACTVLLAVLGEHHTVFAQIGDGAWIAEKDGVFGAVTWPQNGEFANETRFITSPDALNSAQFQTCHAALTGVAGFTDGVQALALNFATKSVHAPFFESMFAALNVCEDETSLLAPLMNFLASERVNERTDDDKTLVLARRVRANSAGHELA